MQFKKSARKGRIFVSALMVAAITLLALYPAHSAERPSLAFYWANGNATQAFMREYLETERGLAGPNTNELVEWVFKYSKKHETDPLIQLARILKESNGRHYKLNARGERSVLRGGSREIGFSQIHPFWIGKTVSGIKLTEEILFDPEGNVHAGIVLYKRYDYGDYLMALTNYNNPKAKRPTRYAKDIDRVYNRMLVLYHAYFNRPQPVDSAIGTSIVVT